MSNTRIGIVLAAIMATGCATVHRTCPTDVRQLPFSKHAYRTIDRSAREITVRIIEPCIYSIGTGTTNEVGLAQVFSQATRDSGQGVPVHIQAKPTMPFGVVWRAVQLATANGCDPAFDVRVGDVEWSKLLEFRNAETSLVASNAQEIAKIVYRQEEITLGARQVTIDELRRNIRQLSSLSKDIVV
ncbi:MAG: hypothetical protein C0404_02695, partial [Verrucomicrobia bacterium]|nr:hypothetical protein [Verrucomicrobiota bacterium]